MIASLPMYDWPETSEYNDQFWKNLSTALKPVYQAVPATLTRTDMQAQWHSDDLLLSQTCIYPLATKLRSSTIVVGTPMYNVDMCHNGQYASVLLVRNSDKRRMLASFNGSTLAYNSTDSQSGFNALKSLLVDEQLINADKPVFFSKSVKTNSHRTSIETVASGLADICAIDPVSWALAKRYDSAAKKVQILTHTGYAPALPLITASAAIPSSLGETEWRTLVMKSFVQATNNTLKQHLLLDGITYIPKAEYMKLPISNLDMITL